MLEHSFGQTLMKIENVNLQFGDKVILKNVNAEIKDVLRPGCVQGQIVGFLGPSGIGKTQLFRILSGLLRPTSGRVVINGSEKPVTPGEVGVVAQSYPLLPHRTIWSNLMLAALQKEKDPSVAKDKVSSYLETFGLESRWELYPDQLSGGQRQRAAIIQQLLCSNHFILMDEPFSGLDIIIEEKLIETIIKVANLHELNTIIVVTHDITAAASVADTLWLMGRDRDAQGNLIPGAHIRSTYNLIERDLCWYPGMSGTPQFSEFVREVKNEFRTL